MAKLAHHKLTAIVGELGMAVETNLNISTMDLAKQAHSEPAQASSSKTNHHRVETVCVQIFERIKELQEKQE